ncbi:hypothetical protein, partial [Acinetobacter indicus]|uniref:hypothetical protein n=1 Tax=Acinetobacter indicus TaxID=756892 RepID=UPI001BB4643F
MIGLIGPEGTITDMVNALKGADGVDGVYTNDAAEEEDGADRRHRGAALTNLIARASVTDGSYGAYG